ncbi:MAG: hypothetical protein AAF135_12265 [Bacteroidota bacterium]
MKELPAPAHLVRIPKVYHGTLYNAVRGTLDRWIMTHNEQFPTPTYRKNHPRRLQLGEVNVLYNILRCWAAQQAKQINDCEPITNIVWINNADIQSGHRDKTNVGRYLGKLAMAGLIGGRRAKEEDPRRYQDQFGEGGGRGFGWVPVKRFRGTQANYGILINPDLIPYTAIPEKVLVMLYTAFEVGDCSPKVENFHLPKAIMGSFRNEEMSEVVFSIENYLQEDERRQAEKKAFPTVTGDQEDEERQAPKAEQDGDGKSRGLGENLSESEEAKEAVRRFMEGNPIQREESANPVEKGSEAPPVFSPEISLKELREGLALNESFEWKDKRPAISYAASLITQYLKKLAPIMLDYEGSPGREYVDPCVRKGFEMALQLIESYEDQEATYNRLTACIDRIQARIQHDPKTFYTAPPNKWFDKDYPFNILYHGEIYLKPWEKGKADFSELQSLNQRLKEDQEQSQSYWASVSPYHGLAWSMKHHMMRYHPKDHRLRLADLSQWARGLQLLQKQAKVSYEHLVEVTKWLLTSGSKEAIYWRKQRGWNWGIRSVAGFRKHWQALDKAYTRHKQKKQKSKAA